MRDMFEGDDDLLRQYLLGELGEPEEERLEQRLLHDDDLFELTDAIADDLLEEYLLRRDLTAAQRDSIRNRLAATPRGQSRLALLRDLLKSVDPSQLEPTLQPDPMLQLESQLEQPAPVVPPPPRTRPHVWHTLMTAAAAAALLVVAGLVSIEEWGGNATAEMAAIIAAARRQHDVWPSRPASNPNPSPTSGTGAPDAEEQVPTAPAEHGGAPQAQPQPTTPALQALALAALTFDGTRGPESVLLPVVVEAAREIEFQVPLRPAGKYASYEVKLSRSEPQEEVVLQPRKIQFSRGELRFRLPGEKVTTGTYHLVVYGKPKDGQIDDSSMPLIDNDFELQRK